jgi:hypothetical protein
MKKLKTEHFNDLPQSVRNLVATQLATLMPREELHSRLARVKQLSEEILPHIAGLPPDASDWQNQSPSFFSLIHKKSLRSRGLFGRSCFLNTSRNSHAMNAAGLRFHAPANGEDPHRY